MQLHIVG